jgi:hypothetical protein
MIAGCIPSIKTGGDVDRKPMELAVSAAATLGQSATLAMNAMAKTNASTCTQVTTQCASYPCSSGAVTITYGTDCPLPLGGQATGTVQVSGMWTSSTSATLSNTFTNVTAGGLTGVVTSASNVTASANGVSYSTQNVMVHAVTAFAGQSSWTVSVDPQTKKMTINGVNQAGGGTGAAQQIDVSDVVLDPSCTLNPVGGTATIQDVSGLNVSAATITFHSTCDGKASADGSSVAVQFLGI